MSRLRIVMGGNGLQSLAHQVAMSGKGLGFRVSGLGFVLNHFSQLLFSRGEGQRLWDWVYL